MTQVHRHCRAWTMKSAPQSRTHVFISYSHKDKIWLERLRTHLKPLERKLPQLDIWDDTRIRAGSDWHADIRSVIARTKVAVLLVTADFLASDFIANNELPPLLEAAESDGAKILSVIVSPSQFLKMPSLSKFHSVNDPSKPLAEMERGKRDAIFVKVTDAIDDSLCTVTQGESDAISFGEVTSAIEERETTRVEVSSVPTTDEASNNYVAIRPLARLTIYT
jgi:hypothetical protein